MNMRLFSLLSLLSLSYAIILPITRLSPTSTQLLISAIQEINIAHLKTLIAQGVDVNTSITIDPNQYKGPGIFTEEYHIPFPGTPLALAKLQAAFLERGLLLPENELRVIFGSKKSLLTDIKKSKEIIKILENAGASTNLQVFLPPKLKN